MDNLLKIRAAALGIDLNDEMIMKFNRYYEMIIEKNKVMNLTTITDYEIAVDKHFIDSLSLVKCIDMYSVKNIVDVGTGAGFPGIPLKIAFPHLHIVLLDSLNKRISFLNDVISELMFDDTTAVHARAEDAARDKKYREKFDLVVSRAVANMSVLCEYCLPFVKNGGIFAAYKSGDSDEEIDAASEAMKMLGSSGFHKCSFVLPGTDISRTIVCVDKMNSCSEIYPRKSGIPAKHPLGL